MENQLIENQIHHREMSRLGQINIFEAVHAAEKEKQEQEGQAMQQQAIDKLQAEMQGNNNPYTQAIGQFLISTIQAEPSQAEKVMAQDKTIMGSLQATKQEAQKVKVGDVGVLTDEQGFAIVLKYFDIKATVSKSTQSVTPVVQIVPESAATVTNMPDTKKRFNASLDEFF